MTTVKHIPKIQFKCPDCDCVFNSQEDAIAHYIMNMYQGVTLLE